MKHDVPIEFRSRHDTVSERMKSYATDKAGRLVRYNDLISRIQIIVDGAHEKPEVEILVHVEHGGPFVAKETRDHFNEAVDLVVEKIERQLIKDKERLKQHKGDATRQPPPAGPDEGGSARDARRKGG